VSEWEEFTAYAGIIADAKRQERERIIKLLEENQGISQIQNDFGVFIRLESLMDIIKGENK